MRINGKHWNSAVVCIRLSGDEKAALKALASEKGMTMSRLLLNCIRGLIVGRAAFLDRQAARLGELTSQVLAVGRNLNQIARAVNQAKTTIHIDADLLRAVQSEVNGVREYLLELKKEEEERRTKVLDPLALGP